jgi:hypothetical protein
MQIIELGPARGYALTGEGNVGARGVAVSRSDDAGALEVEVTHLAAGGRLGRQEAIVPQTVLIVAGDGWVAGDDGVRVAVRAGRGVHVQAGEILEVGTDSGLTAVVVSAERLPVLVDGQPAVVDLTAVSLPR